MTSVFDHRTLLGMPSPSEDAQERLQRLLGLSETDAQRAVEETVDCFRYEVDEYIALRHQELKASGTRNEEIYRIIRQDLLRQRFLAPALTERQIRRRIYG